MTGLVTDQLKNIRIDITSFIQLIHCDMRANRRSRARTYACTYAPHIHTQAHAHIHTHMHAPTHTHTHNTHTCSYMHTRTHARTHARTHTQRQTMPVVYEDHTSNVSNIACNIPDTVILFDGKVSDSGRRRRTV